MGIYISELQVFDNGDDDTVFLGAIMASDEGLKDLSQFVKNLNGIKRSDQSDKPSPASTDAFFIPSDAMPFYVVTPKCRRLALELGATPMSLSMLINRCSNGRYEEAWSEIYPFCV